MSLSIPVVALIALAWLLINGELGPGQLILGLIFGTAFALYTGIGRGQRLAMREVLTRSLYLSYFLLILLPIDILQSTADVVVRLLPGGPGFRPGIVRFPLGDVGEVAAALLTHAISVAPGEILVDLSPDRRVMYIHVIDARNVERRVEVWTRYRTVLGRVFS